MATIVRVDGTETSLDLARLTNWERLKELQKAVGGYIEAVDFLDGSLVRRTMYVNEEGKLRGLPTNRFASIMTGQVIVGDVVVLTPAESRVG